MSIRPKITSDRVAEREADDSRLYAEMHRGRRHIFVHHGTITGGYLVNVVDGMVVVATTSHATLDDAMDAALAALMGEEV